MSNVVSLVAIANCGGAVASVPAGSSGFVSNVFELDMPNKSMLPYANVSLWLRDQICNKTMGGWSQSAAADCIYLDDIPYIEHDFSINCTHKGNLNNFAIATLSINKCVGFPNYLPNLIPAETGTIANPYDICQSDTCYKCGAHGTFDMDARVCSCESGYSGGACQTFDCPFEHAIFEFSEDVGHCWCPIELLYVTDTTAEGYPQSCEVFCAKRFCMENNCYVKGEGYVCEFYTPEIGPSEGGVNTDTPYGFVSGAPAADQIMA